MKSEILLSILLLGGSAGVCVAQTTEPAPASVPAPADAAAPAATPAAAPDPAAVATPEVAQPAEAPAASAPVTDPSAPLVAWSGSQAKMISISSPEKAAFGLLGAAAMIAEGRDIAKANDFPDLSPEIARDVAADLAARKQARLAASPLAFERKGLPKPAVLAGAATDAAYVVDVDSVVSMDYYPLDWLKYHVTYLSSMRLVDTKSKQVAAKHYCRWKGDKSGDPKFTRDELLDDFAKGLKAAQSRGADACKVQFKAKIGEKLFGDKPVVPDSKDEPEKGSEKVAAAS